jgi:uncharacterized protein (TIGR03032 family)
MAFNRCIGLAADAAGSTLWMSSLDQLWRFENALPPPQIDSSGHDRIFVPQVGYTTGDIAIHDGIDEQQRPIFVNTLFSCLVTISETHSFTPLWKPHFISKLAAEDRCHLNGLAMEQGQPRYVTAVSQSDVADGWRDQRTSGGCVIDVRSDEIVLEGLSMPHSPRLHHGKLWLLNSGTGDFSHTGRLVPIAFCPGYARGLVMVGEFAVIGCSRPRENMTFSGLPLDDELAKRKAEARCGLLIVDLRSGDIVHWLRIEGIVEELYDVAVLRGVRRPMALGFKTDEIRRMLTVGDPPADPSVAPEVHPRLRVLQRRRPTPDR